MEDDVKIRWACLLILLGYLPPDQLAAKAYEFTIDETGSSSLRCFNAITDTTAVCWVGLKARLVSGP
jgi:hypothetical protein